jgi:hypothetical protein
MSSLSYSMEEDGINVYNTTNYMLVNYFISSNFKSYFAGVRGDNYYGLNKYMARNLQLQIQLENK